MFGKITDFFVKRLTGKYTLSLVRHGGAALGVCLMTLLAAAGLDVDEAKKLADNIVANIEALALIVIPWAIAQGFSWLNAKKKD
jgi:uncharacterized membrane protein YbjE (DUF340 family)